MMSDKRKRILERRKRIEELLKPFNRNTPIFTMCAALERHGFTAKEVTHVIFNRLMVKNGK